MLAVSAVTGRVASMVLPGALDGATWLTFLEFYLLPALSGHEGLRHIMCDNLAAHEVDGARELAGQHDKRLLFRPRYRSVRARVLAVPGHASCPGACASPDLAPIESCFSLIKRALRRELVDDAAALPFIVSDVIRRCLTPGVVSGYYADCYYATPGYAHRVFKGDATI